MKTKHVLASIISAMMLVGCSNSATNNPTPTTEPSPTPSEVATTTNDHQDELNPKTENYHEEFVMIDGNGHKIPAIVGLPDKEVSGIVVMMHGTGSNKNEAGDGYKVAAPILGEDYHLATIRFDFQGNGDSSESYENYTFDSAVADCMSVYDYARKNISKDLHVGVMGWSQGGTDALLVAGEHPEEITSVVTWAGAPDLSGMLSDENYEAAKKDGYFTMEFEWRDALKVSKQWCDDVKNTDVLKVFKNFSGPVLAIAGSNDTDVDPAWAGKIVETNTNPTSRKEIIEGMDHTFNVFAEEDKATIKKAIKLTGEFFDETLAAKK